MMKMRELFPMDGHKSFYGKAMVAEMPDGSEVLLSYGTPIIKRLASGALERLWYGWTATTGRHIKAFCGINKAEFTAM